MMAASLLPLHQAPGQDEIEALRLLMSVLCSAVLMGPEPHVSENIKVK